MRTAITVALCAQIPGGPSPVSRKVWLALRDEVEEGDHGQVLEAVCRLPADAQNDIGDRLLRLDGVQQWLSDLSRNGIRAITEFEPEYLTNWKERFREKVPPVFFLAGNPDLFKLPSIAIVGSRNAPEDALAFAEDVARECADKRIAVASGGARGVDSAAMMAASEEGGSAIGVMSDSLLRAVGNQLDALESGRWALLSPYSPEAGFSVGAAMGRNKLIYGLADAALVAHAELGTGGTWAGAIEALQSDLCPVGVWIGLGESGAADALLKKGAYPVRATSDLFALRDARTVRQPTLFQR